MIKSIKFNIIKNSRPVGAFINVYNYFINLFMKFNRETR